MANIGKNLKFLVIIPTLLLSGFFVGFTISNSRNSCDIRTFKYINPDLVCEDKLVISKKGYFELKSQIQDYIDKKVKQKQISHFSLYFRDLQNGPTLGINEHEKFSPASLLKIPVLLTYLNLQVDNPDILNTEVGFNNVYSSLNQYFPPKFSAKENTPYKISELLNFMIKYSDNNSYYVLRTYLNQNYPKEDLVKLTYIDLGIADPRDINEQTLSVKAYSSIFVQLYHSSFFQNKNLSEQALNLLVDTDFKEGLVSGVPEDIKIAHKFGERALEGSDQLHDCGIVYYPGNPYLLCIMTRGPEFYLLSQVIGEVSKMVYDEVDSRRIK